MPLTDRYRPVALRDFAGLAVPRKVLSAFARAPYSAAWMFLGPSGTGKTTMALALGEQIGAQVHHVASRACDLEAIDRLAQDCLYYPLDGAKWHLVIVDEADQMTRAAQNALLSKLDSTAGLPNTIWIFTANDIKGLEERFLSRTRLLYFETVAPADGVAYLAHVWHQEGGNGNGPDIGMLLERAQGNLRTALMDLEIELLALQEVAA